MKFQSILIAIALLTATVVNAHESKTADQHKLLLSTGTDHERIEALEFFGKEKDKSQIPTIIEVLKDSDNPKVASQAAITLGMIGEKGESTTALKDKILADKNPEIVYSCILGLFNIHKKDEQVDPTAKEALSFAEKNQDPFVSDLITKIKSKFSI